MDFLIGLSQGITQGILSKQRDERQRFDKTQDLLVDQLHKDAAKIRPEDYPAMMEHIHSITTAKNEKQLNEAYGKYRAASLAEDYSRESQDRAYNAQVPTESIVPQESLNMAPTEGSVVGGAAPGPAVTLPAYEEARPTGVVKADMRDPNAYAQGKIRFQTQEGQIGRQIEVLNAKGKIQTEGITAREKIRAQARMDEIDAKAKSAGLKGIKYGYEDGQLVQFGVDRNNQPVKNYLGDVQLPQEIITDMNNKSRREMFDLAQTEKKREYDLTSKFNKDKFELAKSLGATRIKESEEKIKSGYYSNRGGGNNASVAARTAISSAKLETDGIDKKYAILEREIQDLSKQLMFTSDTASIEQQIQGRHAQMQLLADERDGVVEKMNKLLDNLEVYEPNRGGGGVKVSPSAPATKSPNKKPDLKVGSVRSALGLGGK